MRNHTTAYEETIKTFGRQQAIRITFGNVVLTGDDINSCTPSFKASLLKSCMKEVRIDSNTEIPVGTEIHLEHGILVGNSYEYLDYGYYTVYQVEKKEDTSSFDILCYDKMILAMVDYIDLEIDFPITIRNYIAEICNHLEIDFGSNQDQFVNYDKEIQSELYLDENGDSLDYTFRDVLDEIAQVTASVICIDNNNKLVVKYPERQGEFETLEGTALYIENADDTKIDLELQGNTTQNGTPTPTSLIPINNVTGLQKINVVRKNFFDRTKINTGYNASTTTSLIDNGIRVTNTITGTGNYFKTIPLFDVSNLVGQTFTMRCNFSVNGTASGAFILGLCDVNGNNRNAGPSTTISGSSISYTIPTLGNSTYLAVWFYSSTGRQVTQGDYVDYTNIQIELGSQATSFEPYSGKSYEINLGGDNLIDFSNLQLNHVSSTFENDTISVVASDQTTNYPSAYLDITNLYKGNTGKILRFDFKSITREASNAGTIVQLTITKNDGSANSYVGLVNQSKTIQPHAIPSDVSNVKQVRFQIYPNNTSSFLSSYVTIEKPMFHFGSAEQEYLPYTDTPIELNKIGTYKDFIRKGNGKNGANPDNLNLGKSLDGNGALTSFNQRTTLYQNFVKPNTSYYLTINPSYEIGNIFYYKEDKTYLSTLASAWGNAKSFTTPSNAYYISFATRRTNDSAMTEDDLAKLQIQLEKGSSATLYEPYGYGGKWYIEKNVGKVILNGSENWSQQTTSTSGLYRHNLTYDNLRLGYKNAISNYFTISNETNFANITSICFTTHPSNHQFAFFDNETSVANWKKWLTSNNVKVYYVLANPTYTLIENEELLNQLEAVQLQTGENNISVSGNLPSTIKVSYVEELKSIDEEQLKDINVNFGEKFGPINSVVIARAADSDFIYKEDEQSVEENGLCEIRISDNQILNGDNRVEFLNGIYYQLRGTEYYLNDFSSTGITYLDLLDYYKVNVFDNSYKCLMLNDDIKITQGIEEQVHTEMPETTETEYKALSKEGKNIRKTLLLVNKMEGKIEADIEDLEGSISEVQLSLGGLNTRVQTTEKAINGDGENPGLNSEVQTIKSTALTESSEAFKFQIERIDGTEDDIKTLNENTTDVINSMIFDENGLTIAKDIKIKGTSTTDMKANITNDGFRLIKNNETRMLLDDSGLYFSSVSFSSILMGRFKWIIEANGSLSLVYERS